jgi:putative MFS transporter
VILYFSFYGQLTVEALHISGPKMPLRKGLFNYFLTVFGEIPSLILTMFMIDHPFFGRKNSLVALFMAAAIFHIVFGLTALTIAGAMARFFMKGAFQVIYPLTTESYETRIRTKGFGFCSGFGSIGSVLMPFILIPLD